MCPGSRKYTDPLIFNYGRARVRLQWQWRQRQEYRQESGVTVADDSAQCEDQFFDYDSLDLSQRIQSCPKAPSMPSDGSSGQAQVKSNTDENSRGLL